MRVGEGDDGLVILFRGTEGCGELLGGQELVVVGAGGVIELLQQSGERSLVATGQTDGEVQPVGGGQPARWPKAKPGDRFRYVAAQHLALDA